MPTSSSEKTFWKRIDRHIGFRTFGAQVPLDFFREEGRLSEESSRFLEDALRRTWEDSRRILSKEGYAGASRLRDELAIRVSEHRQRAADAQPSAAAFFAIHEAIEALAQPYDPTTTVASVVRHLWETERGNWTEAGTGRLHRWEHPTGLALMPATPDLVYISFNVLCAKEVVNLTGFGWHDCTETTTFAEVKAYVESCVDEAASDYRAHHKASQWLDFRRSTLIAVLGEYELYGRSFDHFETFARSVVPSDKGQNGRPELMSNEEVWDIIKRYVSVRESHPDLWNGDKLVIARLRDLLQKRNSRFANVYKGDAGQDKRLRKALRAYDIKVLVRPRGNVG